MEQLRKQCLLRKCPSSSERDPSFPVRPSCAVCRKLSWQREPCPDDPGCGCLCHFPHPTQREGSELKTKDPSSGPKPTQKYLVSEGKAGRQGFPRRPRSAFWRSCSLPPTAIGIQGQIGNLWREEGRTEVVLGSWLGCWLRVTAWAQSAHGPSRPPDAPLTEGLGAILRWACELRAGPGVGWSQLSCRATRPVRALRAGHAALSAH